MKSIEKVRIKLLGKENVTVGRGRGIHKCSRCLFSCDLLLGIERILFRMLLRRCRRVLSAEHLRSPGGLVAFRFTVWHGRGRIEVSRWRRGARIGLVRGDLRSERGIARG